MRDAAERSLQSRRVSNDEGLTRQTLRDLACVFDGLALRNRSTRKALAHRRAVRQFGYQIRRPTLRADAIDGQNVGDD